MQLRRLLGVLVTDRFKRPGSIGDRDVRIPKERPITPSGGVSINEFAESDNDFTPVGQVIERIEEVMVLDERDRLLLRLFWQHTANMEMRARKRSDSQDTSVIAKQVNELQDWRIDIEGKSGTNGKLGNLRKAVDGILHKGWWLITVLVGGIGAAAVKLIIVGRAYGELETKVENNSSRLKLLERVTFLKFPGLPVDIDMPAPPEKDSQP